MGVQPYSEFTVMCWACGFAPVLETETVWDVALHHRSQQTACVLIESINASNMETWNDPMGNLKWLAKERRIWSALTSFNRIFPPSSGWCTSQQNTRWMRNDHPCSEKKKMKCRWKLSLFPEPFTTLRGWLITMGFAFVCYEPFMPRSVSLTHVFHSDADSIS